MNIKDKATETFSQMLRVAKPADCRALVSMFDHYTREYLAARKEVNKLPREINRPASLAYSLLGKMDELIEDHLKVSPHAHRVACKKGCSSCCYLDVRITEDEAALLVEAINNGGIPTPDPARLTLQADAREWDHLPFEARACGFLGEDGTCKAYDFRPGSCRRYLVTDTPDDCDTLTRPGARVSILGVPQAEALASAMISRSPSGRMANMLIQQGAQNE